MSCELRLNKPSLVLISMETWWAKKPALEYEKYMRQILDLVIAQKALPILATKADNLEGDFSINATLASLAYEYDIPLWNFWKAVQPLPGGGLTEDGFHLSHDSLRPDDPLFYQRLSDPAAWNYGWTVRNVTALQATRRGLAAGERWRADPHPRPFSLKGFREVHFNPGAKTPHPQPFPESGLWADRPQIRPPPTPPTGRGE